MGNSLHEPMGVREGDFFARLAFRTTLTGTPQRSLRDFSACGLEKSLAFRASLFIRVGADIWGWR